MALTVPEFLMPKSKIGRSNKSQRRGGGTDSIGVGGKGANKVKRSHATQVNEVSAAEGASNDNPVIDIHSSRSHQSDGREKNIAPYALHHDQIVTALIDDALRKRKEESDQSQSSNGGHEQPLSKPSPVAAELKTNSSGIKNSNNSLPRTSPQRNKRNGISGASGSPGIQLLRKRHRSNSSDKINSPLPVTRMVMKSTSSSLSSNILTDPSEFLHPDCILQKKKGSDKRTPRLSFTTTSNATGSNCYDAPSAIGKKETLMKLQQKLSMLSDIESGMYGVAAEMLRSDAVAFLVQEVDEQSDRGQDKKSSSLPNRGAKVETRSILTLRMGFVSMSYGILLQWDCRTRLVELIVLRKMCRDDFLNGEKNHREASLTKPATTRESILSSGSLCDVQSEAHKSEPYPELTSAQITTGERGGDGSTASNDNKKRAHSRFVHTPNPLAYLQRLVGNSSSFGDDVGGDDDGGKVPTTKNNDKPQYFLSVSALSVTELHSMCEKCRNSNSILGQIMMSNNAQRNDCSPPPIRPYIRFSLGEYEHCTKVTKFSNGNATWTKRHHNSCLLPCRPEEFRWFAGREDLTVEVRSEKRNHSLRKRSRDSRESTGGNVSNHSHASLWPTRLLSLQNDEMDTSIENNPILAAVTIPLSSVNIEDEDSIGIGKGWRRRGKTKEGSSATEITMPLRMTCCQSNPIGSISLRIAIKTINPDGSSGDHGRINSSTELHALAKSNILVKFSVDGDSGNGEPKFSESIELGPLTRLMDGWSLGSGDGLQDEDAKVKKKKGRKAAKSSIRHENKSFAWSEILTPLANDYETDEKRPRINWSKRLDHQTKKWSSLKLNKTEPSATDDSDSGWFTFLRGGTKDSL